MFALQKYELSKVKSIGKSDLFYFVDKLIAFIIIIDFSIKSEFLLPVVIPDSNPENPSNPCNPG